MKIHRALMSKSKGTVLVSCACGRFIGRHEDVHQAQVAWQLHVEASRT